MARRRRKSTSGLEGGALKTACVVSMNDPSGVLGEKVGSRDVAAASHVRCSVACCRRSRKRATSAIGENPGGTGVPAVFVEDADGARWAGVSGREGVGERAF